MWRKMSIQDLRMKNAGLKMDCMQRIRDRQGLADSMELIKITELKERTELLELIELL